jgi:hypothetical protein
MNNNTGFTVAVFMVGNGVVKRFKTYEEALAHFNKLTKGVPYSLARQFYISDL